MGTTLGIVIDDEGNMGFSMYQDGEHHKPTLEEVDFAIKVLKSYRKGLQATRKESTQ